MSSGSRALPLAGRRIVVTRAASQAGELRALLEGAGATAVMLPMIEIVPPESLLPLDDALCHPERFDWLVVTSTNALRVIGDRLRGLGIEPSALRRLRSAAVGPATGRALAALGLEAEVVPEQAHARALAAVLADRVAGGRVLLVRAASGGEGLAEALTAAGASVTAVDAYRTAMPAGAAHRAATLFGTPPPPDAVLFTSGSTVAHLGEALRAAGLQFPPGTALVSIGPVTTAALRSAGLDADREALRPSPREMVQACLDLFAGSQ